MYVKRNEVNPWYNCDVKRATVERDIAYRVWKRRKTLADRTRYKEQRKKVNYIVLKAKRLYMGRFLDRCQPVKRLWQTLESVGVKESTDNNSMFKPDQLNDFFAAASPFVFFKSPRPYNLFNNTIDNSIPGNNTNCS
jgi:hypothetical protein